MGRRAKVVLLEMHCWTNSTTLGMGTNSDVLNLALHSASITAL